MRLQDQVALVTGAGSGIGRGAALRLAQDGARVGVLDVEFADETVRLIRDAGGEALALTSDVSNAPQMQDAVARLVEAFGRLDILVANAGINGAWAPIEKLEAHEWDHTFAVNLRGTFLSFKYAVPHLKKQGGSAIVVSSLHGSRTVSIMGSTAYACSKAAQIHMAKKLALELARWKIRVNAICPGSTRTNVNFNAQSQRRDLKEIQLDVQWGEGQKQPLTGRPAEPEEIAALIAFLASDEAGYITGAEINIDAGMSLVLG